MNTETENGRGYGDWNTGAAAGRDILNMGTECLPAVILRGLTILPGMVIHFDLSREKAIEAVEQAMLADQRLLIVTQKEPAVEDPGFDDVYEVGTISVIRQVTKLPGHILQRQAVPLYAGKQLYHDRIVMRKGRYDGSDGGRAGGDDQNGQRDVCRLLYLFPESGQGGGGSD